MISSDAPRNFPNVVLANLGQVLVLTPETRRGHYRRKTKLHSSKKCLRSGLESSEKTDAET